MTIMSVASNHTHNSLMISDLFNTILDYFHPTYDREARQTLAALAQTCRTFSDPALDRLWRKLTSLKPLIRCYTSVDDVANPKPPSPSQLAVIDRYSHRIRELAISATCLRFLQCTSMQPSCLLPNLVALRWNPVFLRRVPIILIRRLLSPTLVSLVVTLAEGDGAILLSFFDTLPVMCPDLKSIEVQFSDGSESPTFIDALSRAICDLRHLESVLLHPPIDATALRHLFTLPSLKVLTVRPSEVLEPRPRSFPPTHPMFCNVEELEFNTIDLDLIINLLRACNQVFHSLRLSYEDRMTSEAVHTFFSSLKSRSHTKPLQRLTLSNIDFCDPLPHDQLASEGPRYCLSYDTFQHITTFRSLHSLTIEWSDQISLDDDELENMTRSWPSLQTLNLLCGRGGYPPFTTKYPTLRGLLSLVAHCPELRIVSLPLDATQVPEIDQEPHDTYFTRIVLPESPVDQALPVAEFLFKHLPCVTEVSARFMSLLGTDFAQAGAYEKVWREVGKHLEKLHASKSSFGSDSHSSQLGSAGDD